MHSVKVRCNAGISALSAFFNGKGCSVALDLPVEIVISEAERPFAGTERAVDKTVDLLKQRFNVTHSYSVSSSRGIPRGKGLKSSSAMTLSVTMGFLRLNGIDLSEEELLDLCADLSIKNGTSSTGAYDDLCSSYYGGACLTDNTKRELITRENIREETVLLAYTKEGRSSSSVNLDEMAKYRRHADTILSLVEEGLYFEAMSMNGTLLGSIFGQKSELIRYLLSSGASYSSQCGKGPAVFGIYEHYYDAESAAKGLHKFTSTGHKQTLFTNKAVMIE